MRITLVRSGGFTGMPVEVSLDEKDLPSDEMDEIDRAVRESGFFSLPTKLPDHSGGCRPIQLYDYRRGHRPCAYGRRYRVRLAPSIG
jgi:hypothetical protein